MALVLLVLLASLTAWVRGAAGGTLQGPPDLTSLSAGPPQQHSSAPGWVEGSRVASAHPRKLLRFYPRPAAITNDTALAILRERATPEGQVLLLVFQIDPNRTALDMLKNFAYHAENTPSGGTRLLNHTLMIVGDTQSYDICRAEGLEVLLDKAFPFQFWERSPWFPGGVYRGYNRYFDVAKHWWGLKVTELGYSVLYMDLDVVLLRDPLAYMAAEPSAGYDVQAQTDASSPKDDQLGFMLEHPCGIYKLVAEGYAPSGAMLREVWHFRHNDSQTALQAQAPCASTGFWYIRPTPASIAFQRLLVHRLLFSLPWGWDQVMWNEVIVAFLVGLGDQPPLRFRLFPVADVANLGVWEARRAAGLPAKPLMVHCAGLFSHETKMAALVKHDWWHPELWRPARIVTAGAPGMAAAGPREAAAAVAGAGGGLLLPAAGAFCLLLATLALAVARWRRLLQKRRPSGSNGRAAVA